MVRAEAGSVDLPLRVLDTAIVLRVSGAELNEQVRRAWSRCLDPDGPRDTPAAVIEVGGEGEAGPDRLVGEPHDVLSRLSQTVTRRAIEAQAGRLLMLHACALSHSGTGRSVALVAPSGTGKTTAATVLGSTYGYLTDETVAVRADGTIAPYPKPLSLVVDGGGWKDQVSADALGLLEPPDGSWLGAVGVLVRDPSSSPRLVEVPTVRALAMLGPESSFLGRLDRPLHRLAAALEAGGALVRVEYADSSQLPDLVGPLFEAA